MRCIDIIKFWRTILAEPYQTRWVDQIGDDIFNSSVELANRAHQELARDTRWLKGRWAFQTTPGVYEYFITFPRVSVERAYIMTANGPQQLAPTTKALLSGEQLRLYDQTANGNTPQWTQLPSQTFPVANNQLGVGFTGGPMFPGYRPAYYIESDVFGLLPPPAGIYWVALDIKAFPYKFENLDDISPFHDDWIQAIAQRMCAMAYFSDQDDGMYNLAMTEYNNQLKACISEAENDNEEYSEGPQLLTHRTFYAAGKFGG
jgi:hypothetical protein